MIYKNLYIIGNGFDQHHGVRCGFEDFMKWVKENNESLFTDLTQVYNDAEDNKWWKDFENSLAQLNISYYANKKGNSYDPDYIKEGSTEEKKEYSANESYYASNKKKNEGLLFKLTQVYNSAWEYNWWRGFENSIVLIDINYYSTK